VWSIGCFDGIASSAQAHQHCEVSIIFSMVLHNTVVDATMMK
jgi:hypothetical protein